MQKQIEEAEQQEAMERRLKEMELKNKQAAEALEFARKKKEEWRARKKTELIHVKTYLGRLRPIFDAIATINSECRLTFKEDSIEYRGVDPAHVMLVDIKITPKSAFAEYNYNGNEVKAHDVGINVDKMLSLLKRRKTKGLMMGLDKYTDDDNIYVSWETGYGKHIRVLGQVDTAGIPESKIPRLGLPASFNVNTKELLEFLKEAEKVSDHFAIEAYPDGVRFFAEGDEDEVEYRPIPKGLKIEHDFKSLFSVDYSILAIKNALPFFHTLKISIGTDNPVMISGEVEGEAFNDPSIEMTELLAPRIESE